jgi:hypothetical protein
LLVGTAIVPARGWSTATSLGLVQVQHLAQLVGDAYLVGPVARRELRLPAERQQFFRVRRHVPLFVLRQSERGGAEDVRHEAEFPAVPGVQVRARAARQLRLDDRVHVPLDRHVDLRRGEVEPVHFQRVELPVLTDADFQGHSCAPCGWCASRRRAPRREPRASSCWSGFPRGGASTAGSCCRPRLRQKRSPDSELVTRSMQPSPAKSAAAIPSTGPTSSRPSASSRPQIPPGPCCARPAPRRGRRRGYRASRRCRCPRAAGPTP